MGEDHRGRVGLVGSPPPAWQSLQRTYRFFSRALESEFDVDYIMKPSGAWLAGGFDAVVSFSGPACWQFESHPDCPILFALHGGAVLNRDFLYSNLQRLETTDTLIVNCSSDVDILREMFASASPTLFMLPLPVATGAFYPLGREAARDGLPIDTRDYVVGFVGRLLPQKNLHLFLRIFAELKNRLYPQTLGGIVVGDYWADYPVLDFANATYPEYIAGLVASLELESDIIHFPASLSDAQLALCYSAMDLLIHPTNSLDENFGYAPLEAMACGTPVLGAAYGGLKDSVDSGVTGFLMPTWLTDGGIRMDFIKGMREAVRILRSRRISTEMSGAAVNRVSQRYSPEICERLLCSAVQAAIRAHRSVKSRQVMVNKPIEMAANQNVLPSVAPPWREFLPAVARYVSSAPPAPSPTTWLRQAAPLASTAEGAQRLMDPAWPAQYRLNDAARKLAERCASEIQLGEIGEDASWHGLVSDLIRLGVIIASDE